jgi:hypothetical protein
VTAEVFSDNTKSWSGDHCVDPRVVPGVFFCNRAITSETPNLVDIAPSVMRILGKEPPAYMQGEALFAGPGESAGVRGMLDPAALNQSGAAPGALVSPAAFEPAATRKAV